jgi:hypothetical protein
VSLARSQERMGYQRVSFFLAERLKCGTAGEVRPERSELEALSAVATTCSALILLSIRP